MKKLARERMKRFVFLHTRLGAPTYPYNVDPIQLATLVLELDRLRDTFGAVVEIGVARGMTTRFICEHLIRSGQSAQQVHAIDTFSSFTERDIQYEIGSRGKSEGELRAFAYNDFDVWKRNFQQYPFVHAHQADCATFNYAQLDPIKLALLDVDLFLPTKHALQKIWPRLCDNGVIIVDDVRTDSNWDGAGQAYREFCEEHGVPPSMLGPRCGMLRKSSLQLIKAG